MRNSPYYRADRPSNAVLRFALWLRRAPAILARLDAHPRRA